MIDLSEQGLERLEDCRLHHYRRISDCPYCNMVVNTFVQIGSSARKCERDKVRRSLRDIRAFLSRTAPREGGE